MNVTNTLRQFNSSAIAALIFFCFLFSACSFPRAVKNFNDGDREKAEKGFNKNLDHPVYGPGAKYYLARLKTNDDPNPIHWISIIQQYCEVEEAIRELPVQALSRLMKYHAGKSDVLKTKRRLKRQTFNRMITRGTVPELLALEDHIECFGEYSADSLRNMIVNKNIDPKVEVYQMPGYLSWAGLPIFWPTVDSIYREKGRACLDPRYFDKWHINYKDATTIRQKYQEIIDPEAYAAFWDVNLYIWEVFEMHHSYCQMDSFRLHYPDHPVSQDCWFDHARDTLCLGKLKPLLAFHRNNPHTYLDLTICNQILCLAEKPGEINQLNAREAEQVEDIILMFNLEQQLVFCNTPSDSEEVIGHIRYLARKYPNHRTVYNLAVYAIDYYATNRKYEAAKTALEAFNPLFKDQSVCPTDFNFQIKKQEWFTLASEHIARAEASKVEPFPVNAWNTKDHDEYGLVSWGESYEVFFTRKNKRSGHVAIMTSWLKGDGWSKPIAVRGFPTDPDAQALAVSGDGLQMLLKAKGGLWLTQRRDIGRRWTNASPIEIPENFAGDAWISPDDSLLIYAYYGGNLNPLHPPQKELAFSKLDFQGDYDGETAITVVNNPLYDEARGDMALNGRMLFFTENGEGSLGENDIFRVNLSKPRKWETSDDAMNIGIPVNTVFEDQGISFFSEYTGNAFFHRYNHCTECFDIWQVYLDREVFPANAMRLAGIVIDENGRPLSGGFMEFTPDYQLNVHAQLLSKRGRYNYTVADSTSVVRLFPEVPGYYSENDTVHFLENVVKGEIIRDTFRLTSFDHIRKHFKLIHSTFFNGEAEFDQPDKAYPELTRLAKIAIRMGAELEISGHTDEVGSESDNEKLSFDRANAVKAYLVEKCGLNPNTIRVYGYGSSKPIANNSTEEGRRKNRRVEIVFKMPVVGEKEIKTE